MTLTVIFAVATQFFSLPDGLLSSLCFVESNHRIESVHRHDGHSHSYGVCQIKITTARQLGFTGTEKELMKPNRNIYYAAKYLHHQLKRYNGDATKAVIAYNQGHAGQLTSTNYSRKVFAVWKERTW